ncbi:MAG: phosphate ABC transporter permease subunit PstC [Bacteriovoracaceae bacterium]|nr:phosphate ABC transporter permease subunit PstC [Bacteriovoracaceae bacterium]
MMGKVIEEEKRQLSDYIKHYRPKQILRDRIMESIIFLGGLSAVIFTIGIFLFVIKEAWPFLSSRFSLMEFLTNIEWYPVSNVSVRYGAKALFVGTAAVTIGSMVLAIPVGIGTAIFISEFCGPKFKEVAKILIELLASIPSVVWGFIAVMVMNPFIINVLHEPVGLNVFNASIILALMSIPMIVSIGEDALRSVPDTYREAAESLGATRLEVVIRVIIPAAKNGLIAAILLGVGRAVGETMAVLMATGHSVAIPDSIFSPVRTLTATVAAEMGEAPKGSEHYQTLFTIGLSLLLITFSINFISDILLRKSWKRK